MKIGMSQSSVSNYLHYTLFGLMMIIMVACQKDFIPKPRGFQRIDFPQRAYKPFVNPCGFETQIPNYAIAVGDDHPDAEKCWYNINYTPFNATLHLSYKQFENPTQLNKLAEDARTLVYKHTIKADEIYETQISNGYLTGMLYELSGNTATNFQFYVTDAKHHYLRGSLYFNERTNNDSIAPVLAFIKEDILYSLEHIRWEK